MSLGRSSFTGFEQGDLKPTRRHRVLELGTRGRPPEQSDRVNTGRIRADWAGGRVGWTALVSANFYLYLKYFQQKVFNFNRISGSQMDT